MFRSPPCRPFERSRRFLTCPTLQGPRKTQSGPFAACCSGVLPTCGLGFRMQGRGFRGHQRPSARLTTPLSAHVVACLLAPVPAPATVLREIGNLLPNNRRQRRTCYALCHILYPVSAAHASIFRMDSNSTSYPPYHPPAARRSLYRIRVLQQFSGKSRRSPVISRGSG